MPELRVAQVGNLGAEENLRSALRRGQPDRAVHETRQFLGQPPLTRAGGSVAFAGGVERFNLRPR